ncbi:unnamed protein product [Kuraishia capsulata CBS 1993]|uniref:FACT complex subunit n=1 Tax=Kuraishia capsulata CBS 1993 TaxID=1382522 RepID=W6MX18_9ASCO|nr:uncharacterized protein KUCA_T00004101001 [Kuraishia capsulata CBS 1993]CDK28120.1 unnamed protein product [Kuraishia capsulata CBS 1993]
MSDIQLNSQLFKTRLQLLQKNLSQESFRGTNGVIVVVGSGDDSNPYQKSTVLHTWLFGYEFPATALYITKNKITILTSVGKAKHLNPLKPALPAGSLEILARTKDADHNLKLFEDFITVIKTSGSKVGVISKDKYEGKFIDEWNPIWNKSKEDFELLDVSVGISLALEVKDDEENKAIRTASRTTVNMLTYFTDEMSTIIDADQNITNAKLADRLENKIDDEKFIKAWDTDKSMKKLGSDFDLGLLDWCYRPIVQSHGKYDLRFSAESTDLKLQGSVIICSLGLRYKSYCSNVSRTFLISPSKQMEKDYDFLLSLQKKVYSFLSDGIKSKDLFSKTVAFVHSERPDLEKNFLKNIGSLIGLEFRDSTGVLNGKNERVIRNGAAVNLVLGFQNLKDESGEEYALMLADTVRVTGSDPILLTDSPTSRSQVAFYLEDEETEKNKVKSEVKKETKPKPEPTTGSRILKSKLRAETKNQDEDQEQLKKEIQKELHARRLKEGLARFSKEDATGDSEKKAVFKRYESYVRETQIPSNVRDLRIHIDSKNQTIILPICGRPVPFHINAYKNGSKNEEGDYTYLRLNFNSPGASGAGSNKEEIPYEEGADKQFVRSFTFRSKDGERLAEVFKKITDLKKDAVKRDSEKKAMSDVVAQANLVEHRGGRPKRLDAVFVRPAPDSKRVAGQVTIHQNGIRYQSPVRMDQHVDILFSNIKHLFFQSCKDELIVVIHCHLKSPIFIGKKKTLDVQFYREASDISVDETGNKRRKYRYGDEDELEQEQEERRRKAALDKEFRAFAEMISDASNGLVDLDVPFRELGFNGVPFRSSVLCLPTRDCLIQLMDPPFLVVTLEEIEIAHLERVQFGLKNFDLVFVFKDFTKPVVHVNTIPMETLEDVKAWLTDVDIPLSEGTVNLNWPTIMKTIQADPYQFFLDGGWEFLAADSDSGEDESSEESEFEVSDENPEDEDVVSEGYSESDSNTDDDASEGGEGEEDESDYGGDSESD